MRPWTRGTHLFCIVAIKNGHVKHIFNPTPENIAPFVKGAYDIYYAPAAYNAHKRIKANAEGAAALWLDVDFKDFGGQKETAIALKDFTANAGVPKPNWVIHSGHGLHVYWVLKEALPKDEWERAARGLKQLCFEHGFKADPARTADIASILRVPGTMNYKDPDAPCKVQVLVDDPALDAPALLKHVPDIPPPPPPKESAGDEWGAYPTACAETIAERCSQIGRMKETKGLMSEPLWRAGLSVVFRCAKGGELIHDWSKGDERYDPGETYRKASATLGPYTCEQFRGLDLEGCEGCAYQVTSPINLGVAPMETPTVEAPETEEAITTQVNYFKITDSGVWHNPPEDKPTRVTDVKLWVSEIRERAREPGESNRASLLIKWEDMQGGVRSATLYNTDLYDNKAFISWLANENLKALTGEVKLLVAYISQYTKELLKQNRVRLYHERLGWYEHCFVLGRQAVTAEGLEAALVQSSSPVAKLGEPSDRLDEWKGAIKALSSKRLTKQAFALLAGFGSPLLGLKGWNSAVVSLAGPSGVGKSLAANLALSIYGRPEHLSQASSATANSIEAQLSRQRHVPYLLDEVTNLAGIKLANFIYTAANGQGKAALTQSREFRDAGTWHLVPFVTSNHPLFDLPLKEIEEAHRRRIVEFYISQEEGLTAEEGRVLAGALTHAGAAAQPFLRFVLKNRQGVIDLLDQAYAKFQKRLGNVAADRFVLWTLAAAQVGGMIATKLGLVDVDVDAVLSTAIEAHRDGGETIEDPSAHCLNLLAEYINQHKPHTVIWFTGSKFATEEPAHKEPLIRDHGNGLMSIHARHLGEWMREQRVPRKVLGQTLTPAIKGTSRAGKRSKSWLTKVVTMAPGVSPVRAYYIDLSVLGLEALSEDVTARDSTEKGSLEKPQHQSLN